MIITRAPFRVSFCVGGSDREITTRSIRKACAERHPERRLRLDGAADLGERLAIREKRRKRFQKIKGRLGLSHACADELQTEEQEKQK